MMDRSDQVFQYPDIQQRNGEVHQYMFEPQADGTNGPAGSMSDYSPIGSDDSSGTEEEDADHNLESTGNTNWRG